jgi:hypothetical protein
MIAFGSCKWEWGRMWQEVQCLTSFVVKFIFYFASVTLRKRKPIKNKKQSIYKMT